MIVDRLGNVLTFPTDGFRLLFFRSFHRALNNCVFNNDKDRNVCYKIENQFGFENIESSKKQNKVPYIQYGVLVVDNVFANVAASYDKMNDIMSFGIHRIWKDIFVQRLSPAPGTNLLDVAGGTGDIAIRFLKHVSHLEPQGNVTVCDINPRMLEVGKRRPLPKEFLDRIRWVECNAESMPFEDNSYDAYTIAFGIRNVTHIQKVLDEAYRVLRPGGRFMCLEFSSVHPNLKWIYDKYSFQIIPVMGEVIAGDWKAYQYLVESIRNFPDQENFKVLIQEAGFRVVTYENLTFGVAAIHSGFKL